MKEDSLVDDMIIETLQFWIRKLKRGDCTREQKKAFLNAIDSHSDSQATIDELAEFYGKSKDAVNSVIKRNYMGKPRRNVVLYSFSRFRDAAPRSWHANTDKSDT